MFSYTKPRTTLVYEFGLNFDMKEPESRPVWALKSCSVCWLIILVMQPAYTHGAMISRRAASELASEPLVLAEAEFAMPAAASADLSFRTSWLCWLASRESNNDITPASACRNKKIKSGHSRMQHRRLARVQIEEHQDAQAYTQRAASHPVNPSAAGLEPWVFWQRDLQMKFPNKLNHVHMFSAECLIYVNLNKLKKMLFCKFQENKYWIDNISKQRKLIKL